MKIIAGTAKGTQLKSPEGMNTRPTLGKVRESIFNVLSNVGLLETNILDIFAGTGAMGLEALSRGASTATFIDKVTANVIKENANRCKFTNKVEILKKEVHTALKVLQKKHYDYIFMDPPYKTGYVNDIMQCIFACDLPRDNAIIIVEHSSFEEIDFEKHANYCRLWKEKKSGNIIVTYLICKRLGE